MYMYYVPGQGMVQQVLQGHMGCPVINHHSLRQHVLLGLSEGPPGGGDIAQVGLVDPDFVVTPIPEINQLKNMLNYHLIIKIHLNICSYRVEA